MFLTALKNLHNARYITQESHKLSKKAEVAVPSAVTGAVSWRPEGIKSRKNEVFLDIVESVNREFLFFRLRSNFSRINLVVSAGGEQWNTAAFRNRRQGQSQHTSQRHARATSRLQRSRAVGGEQIARQQERRH
jgi:hypothetical protein